MGGFFLLFDDGFLIIRLISYFVVLVTVPLILISIVLLCIKRYYFSIIMVIIALLVIYPHVRFADSREFSHSEIEPLYKIMTYSKMGRNRDINSVASVILNEMPDILFLQEINMKDALMLIKELSDGYDKKLNYIHNSNNMTISRYEIFHDPTDSHYSPKLTVMLPVAPVSVWNVHLQKSISGTKLQYKMANELSAQISRVPGPIIVAGDFNATVLNYPYKIIKAHLSNSFEDAGAGLGFTFPSPSRRLGSFFPFLRIDHIFLSRELVVKDVYVGEENGGSDHYPVIAKVSFRVWISERE